LATCFNWQIKEIILKIANKPLLAGFLLALTLPFAANADVPGKHPAYLHALSDLRAARWMVQHRPGDAAVSSHEDVAIREIDAAIGEIKRAAIDDGKNIEDHPSVDVAPNRPGRLHKALELLHKVHRDVAREEDDPLTRGLRERAIGHIDAAIHATDRALADAEHGR
jgi:hypothetical protein